MVPYSCRSVLLLLLLPAAMTAGVMDVEYSWVYADYTFSNLQQRESAIRSRKFIPENCVILDVDVFQGTSGDRPYFNNGGSGSSLPKKRIFVSVPRIKPGNPASLAVLVPDNAKPPLLAPFPSWNFHFLSEDRPDCDNSIISVFRMKIDDLGRLWVVDTGRINQFELNPLFICPPKLLIFDLKNGDKIIRSYTFPSGQYKQDSLFTNIIVDVGDQKGRNTFAYISDTTAYKLIVYNYKNDESWVVDQPYMYPYPHKGHFNINGVTFGLMDGVLGLALGPPTKSYQKLYFHAFASVRESWVYTSTLQNKTLFASGLVDGQGLFFTSPDVRHTQSSVEVMTNDGILISAMMDNSLVCWNSEDSFLPENIQVVYKNDRDFQFPSGMKIIGDRVWTISNQLQNHFTTLVNDRSSIKYRLLVGRVDDLIRGTGCDKSSTTPDQYSEVDLGVDVDDTSGPVTLLDGNALHEWRVPVPSGVPWSYSRSSRVFEDVEGSKAGKNKRRMAVVVTGNANVHNSKNGKGSDVGKQLHAMNYDCRMTMVDGQLVNRNCAGRTRKKTRKRKYDPFR